MTNHLGTVHAIALCNLAELAAGLATEATTPRSMRWIPSGMDVRYLRKATGGMTAKAEVGVIDSHGARDVPTRVSIRDDGGTQVFEATITMRISPRPSAS